MKAILAQVLGDGTKVPGFCDPDNLPELPLDSSAKVIGAGGVILYHKDAGSPDFVAQ